MNRVQFTGTTETFIDEEGKECKIRSPSSGVTNWGQGESLIKNYFPGSGGSDEIFN